MSRKEQTISKTTPKVKFSGILTSLFLAALIIIPSSQSSWAKQPRNKSSGEQKTENSQRNERPQAKERRRSSRENQSPSRREQLRENIPAPQRENITAARQQQRENDSKPTPKKQERPVVERNRANTENTTAAIDTRKPQDNTPKADVEKTRKRPRVQRSQIISEIKPRVENQQPKFKSGKRAEQMSDGKRDNTDGFGDRKRKPRNEIAENISQRAPDKENHRRDNDNSNIFKKDNLDDVSRRHTLIRSHRSTELLGSGKHDTARFRHNATRRVIYEDHVAIRKGNYHFNHVFRDRHHRVCHRIVWPKYYFPVYYNWGPRFTVSYVYPYYHRRYIFVSLGGYWPEYDCIRYYWYPTHSYWWYGYAPVAQETGGDTYNYYTYNYYGQQSETTSVDYGTASQGPATVDHTTFADVREKLAKQQALPPAAQTNADTLFDEGVKAFEAGNYADAELKFAQAMAIEPQDIILPFAYAQAMLAQGKYSQATDMIRLALQKSSPEKQGVYFPRGLYTDENTLMEQIDLLTAAAQNQPADGNLQMLLGYQLLGIGETDKATVSLQNAKGDPANTAAAATLLDIAEKIKAGETQ